MRNEIISSNNSQRSVLLMLANSILQSLQQDIQIEDEDYLFNDEFYITIISSIVPENTCNISVGETEEEKVESLNNLVGFLSSIVEMNLDHINGKAIIEQRDSESVKHLLELILELIIVLREEQNNNQDDFEVNNSGEQQDEMIANTYNTGNINHSADNRESYDLPINRSSINERLNSHQLNDDILLNDMTDKIIENSNVHDEQKVDEYNDLNNSNNISVEEDFINSSKRDKNCNINNHVESVEETCNNISYNLKQNQSVPVFEFEPENSSALNFKEYYSQNDLTRYEKVMAYLANNEEILNQHLNEGESDPNQLRENSISNLNNSPKLRGSNSDMNLFSHSGEEDDSKPAVNISRISEVSRSKENYSEPRSHQKYLIGGNNKNKINNYNDNYTYTKGDSENITIKMTNSNNPVLTNGDSYDPSKISSVESRIHNLDEEDNLIHNDTESLKMAKNSKLDKNNLKGMKNKNIMSNKSSSNNSKNLSKVKKESSRSNLTSNRSESQKNSISNKNNRLSKSKSVSKRNENTSSNRNNFEHEKIEKFESSNFDRDEHNNVRVLKKVKSQKKLIDIPASHQRKKSNSNVKKSEISVSSIKNSNQSRGDNFTNNKENTGQNYEENTLSEENLKFEIMKEFRRIYGDKLDKIMLKNNLNKSANIFEVILRNIKLARERMVKLGVSNSDPDDVLTKEFMLKYNNELQHLINNYQNEEKKRNFFRSKAVKSLSNNFSLVHRIQVIENKNIQNEIQRRRKSRDVRSKHNQIKLCNEIYSKALELEKQKYLEEKATQAELRKIENEEKRNIMIQIESYYKDKINILKEILRREKYEKEIEHRAKIQFLSNFEREKKANFKKQIDSIFDRLDEEDRKYDFQNANSEQIEKILINYYKK